MTADIATKLKQAAEQPHVLVVDDDTRLRKLISRYLADNGFLVTTAHDAADARDKLAVLEYDLVVLDVMMPGEDGLSLTRYLRDTGELPVLLLTARGGADERIEGLEAGADDYLPKPFEPRELLLRINSILRRMPAKADEPRALRMGRWTFAPERDALIDGDEIQSLTSVEARLLKALAAHSGEVLSREKLADICALNANERTIDVQVTRLRKKIEVDPKSPRYLQTVRGEGYVLRPD